MRNSFSEKHAARRESAAVTFDAAKPFYRHVGDAIDAAVAAQFEQTVDAEALKLMLNPVVKMVVPLRCKHVHGRALLAMDAKRAMLMTPPSRSLINGPDAVKASKDPAGDGPFEYGATPEGFALKSKAMMPATSRSSLYRRRNSDVAVMVAGSCTSAAGNVSNADMNWSSLGRVFTSAAIVVVFICTGCHRRPRSCTRRICAANIKPIRSAST